jgi:hypothetical protein
MATKEITVKDFAETLGTDPRTARKFLRKVTPTEEHPGKGGRWTIDGSAANIKRMRKAFEDYSKTLEVDDASDED